ncbi:MAG: alpha/beta fold hydrolase [Gammaproteobacteria bacterium]|nr:alpha/beta fold hydrolase [Gammaproteobacteria bacterium]
MKPPLISGFTVTALLLLVSLEACVSTPRTALARVPDTSECVVLLHGLNRSWRAMQPMAEALRDAGFTTANVDYPSQAGPVEVLAPLAVDTGLQECRRAGANRIHFVTHSIGGILLRYAHQQLPISDLGRVVMLAPPNQGSEVIDITRNWPTTGLFAGKAGMQLGTDANSIPAQLGPVDFELGIIAGTRTINPVMSAMLPNADDGKVSVARTRVDGMDDFLVVPNSHHYIINSGTVIENTKAFLRTGAFVKSSDISKIF